VNSLWAIFIARSSRRGLLSGEARAGTYLAPARRLCHIYLLRLTSARLPPWRC